MEGDEIVEVDVIDGNSQFCRAIDIKLKSGKRLHMNALLDNGSFGILPRIKYGVGGWIKMRFKGQEKHNGD